MSLTIVVLHIRPLLLPVTAFIPDIGSWTSMDSPALPSAPWLLSKSSNSGTVDLARIDNHHRWTQPHADHQPLLSRHLTLDHWPTASLQQVDRSTQRQRSHTQRAINAPRSYDTVSTDTACCEQGVHRLPRILGPANGSVESGRCAARRRALEASVGESGACAEEKDRAFAFVVDAY